MQEQPFDAKTEARLLLREAMTGSLATLSEDGFPFASLVTVSASPEGRPVLLLSGLALHTRNLERDPRASLLLAGGPRTKDPLTSARVTVLGEAGRVDRSAAERRFLARHPEAKGYAGFADFDFWEIRPARGHLVAGFGRISAIEAEELLTDLDGAGSLLEIEASAIDHMNADHRDAVALYATRLLGEADGDWRIIGLDPDGLDLAGNGRVRRLQFPERVTQGGALRALLKRLGEEARARG